MLDNICGGAQSGVVHGTELYFSFKKIYYIALTLKFDIGLLPNLFQPLHSIPYSYCVYVLAYVQCDPSYTWPEQSQGSRGGAEESLSLSLVLG